MFERYTEAARRALFFSRYEVTQRGGLTIEPEHLLLGVLREPKGLIARLLGDTDISWGELRSAVEAQTERGEKKVPTSVEIPFGDGAKRVLQYAAEEADRLLHNHIGTEHLLLGVMRDQRSHAAAILASHGLTLDRTREAIVRRLREPPFQSLEVVATGAVPYVEEIRGLVRQLGAAEQHDRQALVRAIDALLDALRRHYGG